MKKVLLPVFCILALALACGGAAWADTVDDPLHGICNGSSGGACVDNGTNTPLGNSTAFGFSISPVSQIGDLVVDILVPNNYALPTSFTIDFAGTSTVAGTATLFSTTAWTSGDLASYLGGSFIGASPNNPIGAYLPSTQALDPTATGFDVFTADLNIQFLQGPGGSGSTLYSIPSGLGSDLGAYIVGFCVSGCTTPPDTATANSGALLVNGSTPVPTPEPGSLMMLAAGLLGMALLTGRRVLTA